MRGARRVVWVVGLLCLLSPTWSPPAFASDTSTDGHTSWEVLAQDGSRSTQPGTHAWAPSDVRLWARPGRWQLSISGTAPDGRQMGISVHGDDRSVPAEGRTIELGPLVWGRPFYFSTSQGCTHAEARISFHELEYAEDQLERLSLTYASRCSDERAWVSGSLAWNATEPARPAPVMPRYTTPPVTDLTATTWSGMVDLKWRNPTTDPDGEAVVCYQWGDTPIAAPTEHCLISSVTRDGKDMFGTGHRSTMTWTVWWRDRWGDYSPPVSVTTYGTKHEASLVPSSSGPVTGLRFTGRLTSAWTGAPSVGRTVDIVARWPLPGPLAEEAPTHDEEVVTQLVTDADGRYDITLPLRPGQTYQARFYGGEQRMGGYSKVYPADGSSYIGLSSPEAPTSRAARRSIRLVATPATPRRTDKVVFQKRVGSAWRTVGTRRSGTSKVVLRTTVTGRTPTTFRAVLTSPSRTSQPSVPIRVRGR